MNLSQQPGQPRSEVVELKRAVQALVGQFDQRLAGVVDLPLTARTVW